MDPIIPLISSGTEGPLGLKHLPRLWIKTLLSAHGRLPAGYKDVKPGFDTMLLEGIKVSPEATRDYIFSEKPRYLDFEAWIREQPGVDLSPENIERVNQIIVDRTKKPESRERMLAQNNLPADSPIQDSIMLNNLDDWREIFEALNA